jgi:hypothetical protein
VGLDIVSRVNGRNADPAEQLDEFMVLNTIHEPLKVDDVGPAPQETSDCSQVE